MRQVRCFLVTLVFLFVNGGLPIGSVEAQDSDIKVGDMVELYHGGSAYVIRTKVLAIDSKGNLSVQYQVPFYKGVARVTLPPKYFWKAGDTPNAAPNNEFEIGDKVEFYFRQTDQVGQGVVSNISTNGEYFTIQYKTRGRMTIPVSLTADAIWKKGKKKKPLPLGYRSVGSRPGLDATPSAKSVSSKPKPFRTWTSANGNFQVKARFKSAPGKSVKLEKEDGSSLTVELAKLSAADNQYVKNTLNNDLTRRKITARPSIPFSNNRRKLSGGKWEFKHDPSEVLDFSLPRKSVRLSQPIGFGTSTRAGRSFWMPIRPGEDENSISRSDEFRFEQWTMARDGARCFLIANGVFEQECIIQGMNFATGELEVSELIDGHGIGISLDGSKVAFLQTNKRDGTARGELIVKETGPAGAVVERHPVKAFMDESGYSPTAGFFMNDSILVTFGGRFVAFDLDRGSGYSTTSFPKHANLRDAAVSPNRKVVALLSDGGIFLFDVSRGKPAGAIAVENIGFGKIAFSTDGSRILYCSPLLGGIKVFDLTTGELSKEIVAHGEHVTKSVVWPHPRFVLLDNKSLFDLELGVVIWRFKTTGSTFDPLFHVGGNTFITNDGSQNLTPVALPLSRIEKAAKEVSLDDVTVLKEGDSYRIVLDTTFGQQDNNGIRDNFQNQMRLRGISYDENSENVFYCTVETGTQESATIRMNKDETQTVQFTPTTCTIELEVNDALKWRRARVNTFSGGSLVGEEGETPQQAVTRLCQPKAAFFQNARFPSRFILFPNGKDVLGESTISKDGVKDFE